MDCFKSYTNTQKYNIFIGCLNQDCLENLFGNFRQQYGNSTNPTTVQFIQFFKKVFCLQYFLHSPGTNCIVDLDQVLSQINDQSTNNKVNQLFSSEEQKHPFTFKSIKIGTVDYRKLHIPERNAYTYVCGNLIKKCIEKHVCQVCLDYANHQQKLDQSFILLMILPFLVNY